MLFGKFKETVFTRRGSELEKHIKVLDELRKKYLDSKYLKEEYKLINLELQGEKEIEEDLSNLDVGMYVLHDITLPMGDDVLQIDYIIITPAHMYAVECKQMIGNIIVNQNGQFDRNITIDGQVVSDGRMPSPIQQAEKQRDNLKMVWEKRYGSLSEIISEEAAENFCKDLVVMAKSSGTLKMYYTSEYVKGKVVKSDGLGEYLANDIKAAKEMNKHSIISQKQMKEISDKLLLLSVPNNKDYKTYYMKMFGLQEQ